MTDWSLNKRFYYQGVGNIPKQTFFNLPDEKRQRIVDLAMDEFAVQPYSKASLSNVVARAGIAKGSMYQYFEDKRDLFTYLINLAAEKKMTYIRDQDFSQAADFFTMLEQMLLAGVRFNLENPKLGQLMASILDPTAEPFLRDLYTQMRRMSQDYMTNLITQNQLQGRLRQDLDPRLTASIINAILGNGLIEYFLQLLDVSYHDFLTDVKLIQQISDEDIHRVIRQVVNIVKHGLEGEC